MMNILFYVLLVEAYSYEKLLMDVQFIPVAIEDVMSRVDNDADQGATKVTTSLRPKEHPEKG